MNLFNTIRAVILDAVSGLEGLPADANLDAITAEPPREASHGDVATNAAMVLAKSMGTNPRALAEQLAETLKAHEAIESAEIAGPGFINLRLTTATWHALVPAILEAGVAFGTSDAGAGENINVEYVSANPTGPMHIGHARCAVVGDVLARLLAKAGYAVTKEYYVNDAGAQVDVLAQSTYLRYQEACGETIEIPEGLYPGDYLVPVGEALKERHGDALLNVPEAEWMPIVKPFALDQMLAIIQHDLAAMGVEHDIFSSEQALIDDGKVPEGIKALEEKGLVYTGVLEPPKGKEIEDYDAREQLLFKSTEYGDDVDRALLKSDGSQTYFASDIAYHKDKIDRGFTGLINVLGADHGGYVKRLSAAVRALSDDTVSLDVLLYQLVNLFENGEPAKMSKRAGKFVTLADVLEAVGADALRFMMMTRRADAVLDFDLEKVKEQSRDNPVFYVQYAHARICSVLRTADEMNLAAAGDVSALNDPAELALIRRMAEWPRIVEQAARSHEPHRIASYLIDLAGDFHGLWNSGKDDATLRFILEDDAQLTAARLSLITACRCVLASALDVLGVTPVESM